eukprot:c28002_g1_i1 orf=52-2076(+)
MEAVAEGLWVLAERYEHHGCIGQAVKCLEAICQCHVSFLPILEVKTRLRIARLLLNYTDNVTHAKSHLERAQLLLKQIPSCFELKCRAYSLLSRCYHLVGTIPPQKQTLKKGLELAISAGEGESALLWACNFNLQLANALTTEGDFTSSIRALELGLQHATKTNRTDLEVMVFATSILHVHLMQWEDRAVVEQAVTRTDEIWILMPPEQRKKWRGLHVYNELLHVFYLLRVCNYKEASHHVDILDDVLKQGLERQNYPSDHLQHDLKEQLLRLQMKVMQPDLPQQIRTELHDQEKNVQQQLHVFEQSKHGSVSEFEDLRNIESIANEDGKLELGPVPLGGEWLPKSAVHVLVDLMAVVCARPKGIFKECGKRLQSGMIMAIEELAKLGITKDGTEADLQHWAIWVAGVYLILLLQLLENKVIMDLTRTEFFEAQEALVQIVDWFHRFPTILQGCETTIQMLLGQYAHSLGCFNEAALRFVEAAKVTESKGMQAMCHIYAAVSYICIGDADSSSQALDLIGPVYKAMDSYVGVREKTAVLFASGLLQMKQHNLQEARARLANGLKLTHKQLGNHQLVSQYLTVLGSLALALHDTGQACDILKSSLTLAKALHDTPTQIGVLSELTALYQELGESSKKAENSEYETKKLEELKRRLDLAKSSPHHQQLLKLRLNSF